MMPFKFSFVKNATFGFASYRKSSQECCRFLGNQRELQKKTKPPNILLMQSNFFKVKLAGPVFCIKDEEKLLKDV